MQVRKVTILAWQVSRNISYERIQFLVAFVKLRKATLSFIISVCPSVRMQQLGFHWTDFHEISGFHRALLQSITFISLLNALDYTKLT